ncbi:hypothetical protein ACLB2K_032801 [Fragaria x ananassa]
MYASTASMIARLISKLSLNHQDEAFDIGNIRCLKNGFVAPRFYLVGKLNTARSVNFDSFRSVVRSMWRLSALVEDLPAALTMSTTTQLVGETIGPVPKIDERGINNGLVRVRLTLPLYDQVRLERGLGFPLRM